MDDGNKKALAIAYATKRRALTKKGGYKESNPADEPMYHGGLIEDSNTPVDELQQIRDLSVREATDKEDKYFASGGPVLPHNKMPSDTETEDDKAKYLRSIEDGDGDVDNEDEMFAMGGSVSDRIMSKREAEPTATEEDNYAHSLLNSDQDENDDESLLKELYAADDRSDVDENKPGQKSIADRVMMKRRKPALDGHRK